MENAPKTYMSQLHQLFNIFVRTTHTLLVRIWNFIYIVLQQRGARIIVTGRLSITIRILQLVCEYESQQSHFSDEA